MHTARLVLNLPDEISLGKASIWNNNRLAGDAKRSSGVVNCEAADIIGWSDPLSWSTLSDPTPKSIESGYPFNRIEREPLRAGVPCFLILGLRFTLDEPLSTRRRVQDTPDRQAPDLLSYS